ncbi:MFS transporter [Solirubrobacter sp. CPCC 204708]|uniref:MFS transporter n=1 Tax=Solirubrobacter deserti TaxID=2282478 RepID=A0ABT4RPZ4_9ACTN|nr:MFS transporter [Solirubrobacter deserti]MBE2315745.1 MFS transporter [Solirubrobacter deserti]MDA0140365.1 MFS transporter [Solirubrobacter deserti]
MTIRILALVCAAQFMLVADDTIVNVALPSIQSDLDFSENALAWVVDAYLLMFGGFLLAGGRAVDRLGRRRVFLGGIALFTLVSLVCGLAPDQGSLVAARGLQGFAGAVVSPAALAILLSTFPEGHGRTRALGAWGAVMGIAGASGVLLGGVITDLLGWRWVFLVNVPIGLTVLALAARLIPRGTEPRSGSLDLAGAVLVTSGLLVLLYSVLDTRDHGWTSARTLLGFALAVVLLVAFAVNERHHRDPLLPAALLRRRAATASLALVMLGSSALFAMFFFLTLYMQNIQGWSPIETGLSWLPFSAAMLITSGVLLQVLPGRPLRPFLVVGALVTSGGFVLLTMLDAGESFFTGLLPAEIALGVGIGALLVPTQSAATSGVGEAFSGMAAGLITTCQQIGGALGIAVLVTVAGDRTAGLIEGGTNPLEAAVSGYATAFWVGAGLTATAAATALLLRRMRAPHEAVAIA